MRSLRNVAIATTDEYIIEIIYNYLNNQENNIMAEQLPYPKPTQVR